MNQALLSKAEQTYFHPDELVGYGIPERCGNCPGLQDLVSLIALSELSEPVGGNDAAGQRITTTRQNKGTELIEMTESCSGYEQLDDSEIDTVVTSMSEDDGHSGEPMSRVGYRCAATGKLAVAIAYTDGVTQLSMRFPEQGGQ